MQCYITSIYLLHPVKQLKTRIPGTSMHLTIELGLLLYSINSWCFKGSSQSVILVLNNNTIQLNDLTYTIEKEQKDAKGQEFANAAHVL